MDTLFIFGAKYVYLAISGIGLFYFLLQSNRIKKDIVILSVLALPIIYAVSRIAGMLYYHEQPFVEGNFTPLIPHEPDNSFPSDHTLLGAAISSVLYPFSKKVSALLWLFTLVVGVSRVYAGVHHPIDIAGSIIISIVITLVVYGLIKGWKSGIVRKNLRV